MSQSSDTSRSLKNADPLLKFCQYPINAWRGISPGGGGGGGGGSSGNTVTLIVPVADAPQLSVALTVNTLSPALVAGGVPERAPLLATDNHAGPLIFENVSGLPSGSDASPAIEALYGTPTVAAAFTIGLPLKAGGRLVAHGSAPPAL